MNTPAHTTLHGLIRRFHEAHPLEESLELSVDFGGYVTRVVTNSLALKDKLAHYFRDFPALVGATPDVTITALEAPPPDPADLGLAFQAKEPDPGKSKIKEEWADLPDGRVVRKRLTGMLFLFGGGENLAVGPCVDNDNQVVNFINNRFIEWHLDRGALLFHAAGVASRDKGVALAGFSGMGKSTLALHAMGAETGAKGPDFVSNDRLMVRRDSHGLTMHGLAKMPRINPGTVLHNPALASVMTQEERERFAELPPDELWSLEHKYDAFIDECFGPGRFRLSTPMTALALLNWKRDNGPVTVNRVDLRERRDLMPAFMKSVGLFYDPRSRAAEQGGLDASEDAYLELLAGCPVYEFSGGVDFEAAAKAVNDLL